MMEAVAEAVVETTVETPIGARPALREPAPAVVPEPLPAPEPVAEAPAGAPPPPRAEDAQIQRPPRRAGRRALLAALLVAAVVAGWLLGRYQPQPPGPPPVERMPAPADAPSEVQRPVIAAAVPADPAAALPGVDATPAVPATPRKRKAAAALPTVGFASGERIVVPESTRFIKIRVRATGALREPVELSVAAVGGAARVNEDFVPPVDRLTLTRREPTADVLVSLLSDEQRENVEDFSVELGIVQGQAQLATGSVVVVLTDDD
jgi:hypothetical protein